MRILHVSDERLKLTGETQILAKPLELVQIIEKEYPATDLFIIEVNYEMEGVLFSDYAGIRLLKLLRLKGFKQHCILYSYVDTLKDLLVKNPKNLILTSPGVSFYKFPQYNIDYKSLVSQVAPDSLISYFKVESYDTDCSHFQANWWGAYKLLEIQQIVEEMEHEAKEKDYQETLGGAYEMMNSFKGLLARYLNQAEYQNIARVLAAKEQIKRERFLEQEQDRALIAKDVSKYREIVGLLDDDDFLQELGVIQQQERSSLMSRILEKSGFKRQKTQAIASIKQKYEAMYQERQSDIQFLDEVEEERAILQELVADELQKQERILLEKDKELEKNQSIKNIRRRLAYAIPRVLFVDDQANEGWSSIFQRIIYGGTHENFHTFIPDVEQQDNKAIADRIEAIIIEHNIELLILDLRLRGEEGQMSVDDISGVEVLKLLNQRNISCPILITTASNKVWTYQRMLNLGASAYWIKQGLASSNNSTEYTIQNYLNCVRIIDTLTCNSIVKFYYKFQSSVTDFCSNSSIYWWERSVLGRKREDVFQKMRDGLSFFKACIHNHILQQQNTNLSLEYNALIIVRFFEVIEYIFRDTTAQADSISKRARAYDEDRYSLYATVFIYRNQAIHNLHISDGRFRETLKGILKFIKNRYDEYYDDYEEVTHEPVEDDTPLLVEKQAPQVGVYYTTKIKSFHTDNNGVIFLEIPEDLDFGTSRHFKLHVGNFIENGNQKTMDINKLKIGDVIKTQLLIKDNGIFGTKAELIRT